MKTFFFVYLFISFSSTIRFFSFFSNYNKFFNFVFFSNVFFGLTFYFPSFCDSSFFPTFFNYNKFSNVFFINNSFFFVSKNSFICHKFYTFYNRYYRHCIDFLNFNNNFFYKDFSYKYDISSFVPAARRVAYEACPHHDRAECCWA